MTTFSGLLFNYLRAYDEWKLVEGCKHNEAPAKERLAQAALALDRFAHPPRLVNVRLDPLVDFPRSWASGAIVRAE